MACTTSIVPPSVREDARTVYLVDHGWHTSLVIPAGSEGRLIRYEYGDWDWKVHDRRGISAALSALFCPSPAALGRNEWAGPPTAMAIPIENLYAVEVEAEALKSLRARLDAKFEEYPGRLAKDPEYDIYYRQHSTPYTLAHNSNRVVSDWLEDLGCRVEGTRIWSSWKIRQPE